MTRAVIAKHLTTIATVVFAVGDGECFLALRAIFNQTVVDPFRVALLVVLHLKRQMLLADLVQRRLRVLQLPFQLNCLQLKRFAHLLGRATSGHQTLALLIQHAQLGLHLQIVSLYLVD